MDQQHPIPQQISSYQFKLVGNMTLKQFFQIAGGALFSLLFYASNLHPVIKWPLVIFFALFGAALAFLPFEERPLEQWVISFFKAVYTPTTYFWGKTTKPPVFFKEEASVPQEHVVAPHGEKELEKYLQSLPGRGTSVFSKLEEAENTFLSKLTRLFGSGGTRAIETPSSAAMAQHTPQEKQQEMTVPQNIPTVIPQGYKPRVVVEEKKPLLQNQQPAEAKTSTVAKTFTAQEVISGQAAQFSVNAAPPLPPEKPNTLTGQVVDAGGKIIESAILEIRDVAGRPVRAVKTNKVGHFIIVTPLQDGRYEIISEKEGLNFEPLTFEATGSIIPPIAIRSKNKIPTPIIIN
ncbi:PrgI family protein [Patescibacteria group bacterium]|nr:PrgI family protein [Patescibacteria group bacterium]MBU0776700.1 PrgI family protein [Patescibacteria group bacterium]MBU0846144.1 PrgI family protein [Patescibacteria group bacterium]MBU0922767.1 PrgI family protein [Patescibacteria group bacterium]MBU1066284.1 PrgI family protein [Patescibacteria group bacterium]